MRAFAVLATLPATALAHMQLHYPAPFNASNNPHLGDCSPDPHLQYRAPTATWQAGSIQAWSVKGIGNHYGGSCQVGSSVDKGMSFSTLEITTALVTCLADGVTSSIQMELAKLDRQQLKATLNLQNDAVALDLPGKTLIDVC
ncbi:hypothetical protein LTR53_006456 [Teratosphaeriaceae sp. CCFEE 6253]|nr:hypothetical protein LTR53_006456 [Teratosphaeriaceae sp. CCFEE 6253]